MSSSAFIRSRQHATSVAPLLGSSFLLALSGLASAQAAGTGQAWGDLPSAATDALPEVAVKATRVSSYKADTSASGKITQPLLDTPKTIQVVKKEVLKEQGAATLMEALRNTPGITMQLGEGGSTSAGDTFQMRGFSTQTSTFVDGIRDLGAVTRDVFNVEQVEVVKGPSGADVGRGAASGYINLISKQPSLNTAREASVTMGTASKKRVTADLNQQLDDTSAFRLNLMSQDSGVDGRDVVKNRGFGIAPSVAFGLGTPTRVILSFQHMRHDNIPDGGIPAIGLPGFYRGMATGTSAVTAEQAAAINAAPAVDQSNYYGSNKDHENVNADMFTTRLEHDFSDHTTVRNMFRYGRTRMDRVLTSVGAIVGSNVSASLTDRSQWTVTRSRQRTDQLNDILVNQTSVNSAQTMLGRQHDLAAGLEFMYERQRSRGTGTTAQTIEGVSFAAIANPAARLYNPGANDELGVPYLTGADTDGHTLTASLYALDTLTLNEQWKLNGGMRIDRYFLSTKTGTIITASTVAANPGYAVGGIKQTTLNANDTLMSWNLGAVFKPTAQGSIYAAMANSLTPPGGNNFVLSSTATNQANPAMDPQQTRTVELGTKWDLLDQRLNLNATLYRTENDKQTSQDPGTGETNQYGKTRVEGLELAAVGQLTPFWQVSAGIAKMKTRQLDSYSVSSGVVTTTNGVRWSPELSATLWTSYTLGTWTLGGGLRHVGEQKRVITTSTEPATMPRVEGYTVAELMAAWKVSKLLRLQLNVGNLFDKTYISTLNNNGARVVMGAPRSASLTASVMF